MSRLVPRRGAGPELRSSGREIDEYLMRLLHAGAMDASQDVVFHGGAQTLVSSTMPCLADVWRGQSAARCLCGSLQLTNGFARMLGLVLTII